MEGSTNREKTPKLKPWMVAVFVLVVILFLGWQSAAACTTQ